MRRGLYFLGFSVFAMILSAALQSPPNPEYVRNEIIVKYKPGISAQAVANALESISVKVKVDLKKLNLTVLTYSAQNDVFDIIDKVGSLSTVDYAEPNYIYHAFGRPNDTNFGELWGLENTGQGGGLAGADIHAITAWDMSTGSDDVIVGIVDTGIDYRHEDIGENVYKNPGEDAWQNPGDPNSGNGIDDDGNGYVDDYMGWNFLANTNNPYDDNMHGTHVAGTIGAVGNNAKGVAGVNWKIKLLPLKFLDEAGSGTTEDAIKAIVYAADLGARVLNNSWGGGAFSNALEDAIEYANDKGVVFVAAAGNDGTNNDVLPQYPANYDLPNVISVAASDRADQRALWSGGGGGGDDDCGFVCGSVMAATPGSNYGPKSVHLAAPGKEIFSTVPGGYRSLSGTSMATPHVVGAAGLLLSRKGDMSPLQVREHLMNTVDKLSAFENTVASGGRLNIAAVLQNF